MDAYAVNHWLDLPDSLSGHSRHVQLRVRAGDVEEGAVEGRSLCRLRSTSWPT